MRCPIDETELVMSERSGVEIDYCPKCRGVWLDRGELDKIIEQSASDAVQRSARGRGERDDGRQEGPRERRRESFLGDLFDF